VVHDDVSDLNFNLISSLQVLLYLTGSLSPYVKCHSMVIDRIYQEGPGNDFSELPPEVALSMYVNHRAEDQWEESSFK
jgi:hypothetical protein